MIRKPSQGWQLLHMYMYVYERGGIRKGFKQMTYVRYVI